MNDDHKELLDTFVKMSPENQACLLSCFRVVYASQENAKQAMRERLGGTPEWRADEMAGSGNYEQISRTGVWLG